MIVDTTAPFVAHLEKIGFVVVIVQCGLLAVCAVALRFLLRVNLTLKPQLLGLISQLKQAKVQARQLNVQLVSNQASIENGLLSVGNRLPKPLRWVTNVLQWIV